MRETLNLDGDDLYAICEEIERMFDFEFSGERWDTLGDAHAGLMRVLLAAQPGAKCASAMAFYRLRRALIALGVPVKASPDSELALLSDKPRPFVRSLASATGLRVAGACLASVGWIGVAVIVLASILMSILLFTHAHSHAWWAGGVGLLIAGIAAIRIDPGRFERECHTMRALTESVAVRNYGRLVKDGARAENAVVWDLLLTIISDETGISKTDMGPHTTFVKQPRKRVA